MAQYTHRKPQNHNPPNLSVNDIVYRYRTVYRFYYIRYRIQYRVRYSARCLIFQFEPEQGGFLRIPYITPGLAVAANEIG